jgi:hypothetical protein
MCNQKARTRSIRGLQRDNLCPHLCDFGHSCIYQQGGSVNIVGHAGCCARRNEALSAPRPAGMAGRGDAGVRSGRAAVRAPFARGAAEGKGLAGAPDQDRRRLLRGLRAVRERRARRGVRPPEDARPGAHQEGTSRDDSGVDPTLRVWDPIVRGDPRTQARWLYSVFRYSMMAHRSVSVSDCVKSWPALLLL